jgi:hypothetical protein
MKHPDSFLAPAVGRVDRRVLLAWHQMRLAHLESRTPLQVGDGTLAITVDVTGLRTFPERFPVEGGEKLPGTFAQWGMALDPAPAPVPARGDSSAAAA